MKPINKFFLGLAVDKATAKLAAKGFTAEQCAEWLLMPGHVVELLNHAESLHVQAFDRILAS